MEKVKNLNIHETLGGYTRSCTILPSTLRAPLESQEPPSRTFMSDPRIHCDHFLLLKIIDFLQDSTHFREKRSEKFLMLLYFLSYFTARPHPKSPIEQTASLFNITAGSQPQRENLKEFNISRLTSLPLCLNGSSPHKTLNPNLHRKLLTHNLRR